MSDRPPSAKTFEKAINQGFRDVVDLAIIGLIVTGVIITFDRLSSGPITTAYYILLALKVITAIAMFFLARDLGTRLGRLLGPHASRSGLSEPSLQEPLPQTIGVRRWLSPSRMVIVLGLVAFFLSMLLVLVFEKGTGPA